MRDHHPTVITTSDHDRLQAMMCTMIGARTPLAGLLRQKLGSAVVMLPTDVGPDVVMAGRRVRFTIDGVRSEERSIIWEPQIRGDRLKLSLRVPRGLALLGLSAGQSISYTTATRRTELLEIDYVYPDDDDATVQLDPFRRTAGMVDGPSVTAARELGGTPLSF
jgi:regulator of nucleoside diphosphate kinase